MRTLRPERKSRGGIIALWLGLAASISFVLIAGALPAEERIASVRANLAATAAPVPSLMDGAVSSIYRALCPYVTDCEVVQNAHVIAPPQERVRPLAQQPTPLATDKRNAATTVSTDSASSPQTNVVKQPARLNDVSPRQNDFVGLGSGGYITQPARTEPVERVVERIIQSPPFASGLVLGASTDGTAAKLSDLQDQINALSHGPQLVFVPSFSGPAATTPVNTATFAQSQKIDNLGNVTITNATVNGVTGLTDADIPDGITASNYLALTGGAISGDLTMSGTLTAGALSVAALSSGGAIEGPYVNATSTTAPSTFAGFVGVGTTTPWGRLSIKGAGTGTGKALVITDSSDVERMVVQDNGNVGIGTTTPQAKLHVVGSNYSSAIIDAPTYSTLQFNTNGGVYGYVGAGQVSGGGATDLGLRSAGILQFAAGNTNSQLTISNGNATAAGSWTFNSQATHLSNGFGPLIALEISGTGFGGFGSAGGVLSGGTLTDMAFQTNSGNSIHFATGGTVLSNIRMTIASGGNVGIGTTSPRDTLHVYSSGASYVQVDSAAANQVGFFWTKDNSNKWLAYVPAGSDDLRFWDSIGDKVTFQRGGNVGIGTTSPSTFKFQVKGDVGPDASNTYNLGSAGLAWECLYYDGGQTGLCASDERLKDNVADLTFGSDPLAQIAGLRLRTFNYKSAPDSTYSGLVAQEVEAVAPELVVTDVSTTYKTVKYGDIQWLVISAVQALIARVNELASVVAAFADHFTTKELTFTRATGDEIDVKRTITDTLCVRDTAGATCITRAQLDALLQQAGQSPAGAPTAPAPQSSPTTGDQPADATVTESSTPPVIDSPPLIPEEPEPTPATSTEPAAADEAGTPAQSTSL
jgi:Chaperone of endosialidase